jgi:uncharacterized protein (DUF2126 family)/transglutaminase-like putative cysteine protease
MLSVSTLPGGDAHPLRVALTHRTEYRYPQPVSLAPHIIRLRPAPHCRTPILSYSLRLTPTSHYLNWQQDPYSNYLARIVFLEPTTIFRVEVDLVAALTVINPFDFFIDPQAETFPFTYEPLLSTELTPYLEKQPAGPRFQALVDEMRDAAGGRPGTIDYFVDVNRRVQGLVKYIIRMEPGVQTPEETLTSGSGSCRDSAWLLTQLLRHLGLAARFVSGYLIQLVPDNHPLSSRNTGAERVVRVPARPPDGPVGPSADFTDLHAWAEVYIPGAGWVGLDPTSGLLAGEGHIPLACVADPGHGAPITGSFNYLHPPADGTEPAEEFAFFMAVTRLHEDPRVTKPYTSSQWSEIDALGQRIDEKLQFGDVRLTMGGEPTFVSSDDRDGEEWNFTAVGPNKRRLAGELLLRLRDQFAPGGMLHYGQGKLYPGESLPRWALGCYWRRDGVSIWQDPALVADETYQYGYGSGEARRFLLALAGRLGIDSEFCIPAYEDVWHYLWRERRLPVHVDPLQNNLEDPEERKRLARIFERGLGQTAGYALPLARGASPVGPQGNGYYHGRSSWQSGPWFFRREHMYLIPGDSPMGLRLPLDSLPGTAPEDRVFYSVDPMEQRGPLPPRPDTRQGQATHSRTAGPRGADRIEQELSPANSPPGIASAIRTALCVEPREGRLYVFLPPLRFLEDYLELIAAVEETAAELRLPVLIEGYPPPSDHRLNHLHVTPDPGVLEVNIHPAHSWTDLVKNTTALYQVAQETRLSTEKFMLDGRHTGTGGGNHIVLGGPTPADSPILRRPDLLRSLLGYWHNHPALSYLFSGLFVGPTSQAPRVDEARNDSLYELEIAFRQVPDRGGCVPWLVDRLFRHLLVDGTGNTHRTEFCIDKLYSPDTSGGRRGLVEMRGFEMPPHPEMSLVQHLLLRALIARFWTNPYKARLVRWGPELHDRWLLPHFLWQDLLDVLDDLEQHGLALKPEWFAPHHDFRMPRLGSVTQRSIHVELRQAIEPWHVLGEQGDLGGNVRYVDSSVERLQVKVTGMTDPRHVLVCNGRRVPLHPTGTVGEFVAGVRYRAWQPPECLHPTIPVQAPLVFDIVDAWLSRSIGGCTYYVSHPGGRGYDTFPINALEAEARRASRFSAMGHTPGMMNVLEVERAPENPLTLDLRRG